MGANVEAFTNSIRKIGFWNVESRVVAIRQRVHFELPLLRLLLLLSPSLFHFYRPDDDEDDDDGGGGDDDDDGIFCWCEKEAYLGRTSVQQAGEVKSKE